MIRWILAAAVFFTPAAPAQNVPAGAATNGPVTLLIPARARK